MNAHERYLFDTLGYIVVPDVIGADEVAELNRHLDEYDLWGQAERGELAGPVEQRQPVHLGRAPAHLGPAVPPPDRAPARSSATCAS